MYAEFKAFLLKSNALALAIGVILGAALGTVVKSLVDDIIMPPIGKLLGGVDFSSLMIDLGGGAEIRYGLFINNVITFVIVAFVVFMIARSIIREPPAEEVKVCSFCKEPNAVDATRCKACTSEI